MVSKKFQPQQSSPDSSGIAVAWQNQSGFQNLTGLSKASGNDKNG